MTKPKVHPSLLQLLVRVYNQSIQSYYHFPDVIICGDHRLEKEEFDLLIAEGFVEPYYSDSFGKLYKTSKRAAMLLQENLSKKRHKLMAAQRTSQQAALPFHEVF